MKSVFLKALAEHWGYDSFRPLQEDAMRAVAGGRDSVVVLPTGGGKSLCFQVPAVTMDGLAIVVSPLISLMKDQVDALRECGIKAARLDSSLEPDERSRVYDLIDAGELKLLYLSPERLLMDGFAGSLAEENRISFIAVDEAHCVSMWGHDFRPEYRMLGDLKQHFPGIGVHAYTATATPQVRDDIAVQLHLENPEVLVGSFDRPNLRYKVERAADRFSQVCSVVERHPDQSGIIYCIRRKDVDQMCAQLQRVGYKALPYHAGMEDEERKAAQDAFIADNTNIIVATVAFGMGIDKPDVRYVVHAGMPKSLEHYQQESGRAGRDGLEADCHLIFSGNDYRIWEYILSDLEGEASEIARKKLSDIYNYCTGLCCRHQALVSYFGQNLEHDNCGACDVCLGEIKGMSDSLVTAQKIISSVLRQQQRFGADYTAGVLIGSRDQRILQNRHDKLSTYGLLSDFSKQAVRGWVEQLVDQGCLEKTGDYKVLTVTARGWQVLRGQHTPGLLAPPVRGRRKARAATRTEVASWEGVDHELFEALRRLRREIAGRKHVPAYVVFGDTSLRDMARKKPRTVDEFLQVHGVGQAKSRQYAKPFLEVIRDVCGA